MNTVNEGNTVRAPRVNLPLETRGCVYFIDEAGSKGSSGQFFVTAAVKTSDPDRLGRAIQAVRDRNQFTSRDELKFGDVTKYSMPILCEVVDAAVDAGATFGAFVLDKRHFDPWADQEQWRGHLFATERLLRGMATRSEVSTALLDFISVPAGVSYGDALLGAVNSRFQNKRFVSAVSLDSRTCIGLQVADIVASAVYHYRQGMDAEGLENYLRKGTPKAMLARHVAEALELGTLSDGQSRLAKIQTSFERSLREMRSEGRL